ncbi:probable 4-coumarate--CoA ligase 1 [Schistocerca cancellata]|uniref:probable 4-coumarate--CoA ligase 1 n=1 Tax=Schistocerca cancellata TaxID=274614 RepID=UPI0021192808|nr:probable 4-coumarate--CoA ligase 1 [Schistocerca cancellata]
MWSVVGRCVWASARRHGSRCLASSSAAAPSRVIQSPLGEVQVPELTVTQYLWQDYHRWPDKKAITCAETGHSLRYGEVREQCRRLAWALLSELGMQPGEALGIVLPNGPEFLVAVHGALEAGLVVTFANPAYTAEEVCRQFRDSGVRCLVTTFSRLVPLEEVRQQLGPRFRGTIVVDGGAPGAHNWTRLLSRASPVALPPPGKPRQLAVLPYSSGTTGLPKGVCLSHYNLVANLQMFNHPRLLFFQPTTDSYQEVVLSILPFYHIYGFNIILNLTVSLGIHNVTLPKFTPASFVKALEDYKPTMMFVVPSLLLFLATHPMVKPEHLSSLKMVMSGAAPAKESLIQKFLDKAGHDIFVGQGFGMTESSPVVTVMPLDRPTSKYDSCGQLAPGTKARIVSLKDGTDQGPGETGELLVKGPQVMMGYFNNEKATRETIDSDGWLHTGDVAYYDEDGYFYIVDRTKELIKVKGNQVSPTELESIIMELPEVADVAVVGMPDEISGEVPKAFIVLKSEQKLTAEAVEEHVTPRVARYKRLAGGVEFISEIPRNPSGKVLRAQLRDGSWKNKKEDGLV